MIHIYALALALYFNDLLQNKLKESGIC